MIKRIVESFIDFLFPKSSTVLEIEAMTPYEFADKVKKSPRLPYAHTMFRYKDKLVHDALWEVKYHKNRKIASLLAPLIIEEILNLLSDEAMFREEERPIVIPIPPSEERLRTKHFDQMKLILEEIGNADTEKQFLMGIDFLYRAKSTRQQSHLLNRQEREKNVDHAFKVKDEKLVRNKVIILLDDVTTTGATLTQAKLALEEASARKVYPLAIAH